MKPGEIRAMSDSAILDEIAASQKKILELRCSLSMGDAVNPAEVKNIKRNIARMKTIYVEKKSEVAK